MATISRNALLAIVLVISAGCGQAGSGSPAQSPPPGDGQSTAAAPAEGSCGETADKVEQHVRQPGIRSVTMLGQCTLVSIETTLGDDESSSAQKICDAAAEVAYSGDTSSISVHGRSGKELSVGIADAKCLAQP
ncbi:hypothetical protein [Nonomuraea zeae]|uniref:DUF4333 domain-containing protein n=1 Tax=Nonomuraea zeae TaxID=1642303 RepID=A0A5S4H2R4_9ACTN|nr:hypothetical protein [Nonomuraea zeae]TMR39212.1 hypothetical protein ETD85_02255 [Nonomuraea zeae]